MNSLNTIDLGRVSFECQWKTVEGLFMAEEEAMKCVLLVKSWSGVGRHKSGELDSQKLIKSMN